MTAPRRQRQHRRCFRAVRLKSDYAADGIHLSTRQCPDSAFVFTTERGGPFTSDAINRLVKRIGALARFAFPIHAHMLRHACEYALANAGHDTRHTRDVLHAIERGAVQGPLEVGRFKVWAWSGTKSCAARARAAYGRIFLSVGDREQTIRVDWLAFLNNRYHRPRWLCPGCGRGAYHLHDNAGIFACRACCRYDYKSRYRQRFNPAFGQIAKLRRKLRADPPLSPLPPGPRWRMSRVYYDRLVAELARAEAAAYADVGRLLANLDKRLKP
jgi:hypothetical protein